MASTEEEQAAWTQWQQRWGQRLEEIATKVMAGADAGHGLDHVQRVVRNARRIGQQESADPQVILPAAWLHDCVWIPKNHPDRSRASLKSSQRAAELLREIDYPETLLGAIEHAVVAHSFSAGVPCQTLEARVVQDADRLEALGAIGLARCLMTGGSMHQKLFHPEQPFPSDRLGDDNAQSVDHFFLKLLRLAPTMQTPSGRLEAQRRTGPLIAFLESLAEELGRPPEELHQAIQIHAPWIA